MNGENVTFWGLMVLALSGVHPEAAAGAVCGGLFFWSLSPEIPIPTRIVLAFASIGTGYGTGLPAAQSEDWNGWTWVASVIGASMIHVVLVSMRSMVKTGSPLPPWMSTVLEVLPWRRGSDPIRLPEDQQEEGAEK